MMANRVLVLALAGVFICGMAAASPSGGSSAVQPHDLSAAAKKKKKSRRPPPPRQIACTFFGCRPVPTGCYQREGFDFWGNPTGFDVIICPGR